MTPMPTQEAKEKYTVPDGSMMSESSLDTSGGSLLPGDDDADNTVELEGDLNALMTSIGQGHGTDDQADDEHTVELEGDISALLKNADDTQHRDSTDGTIPLEGDMDSLLSTVSAGVSELRRLSAASPRGIADATKTSPTSHHVTLAPPPPAAADDDDEFSRLVNGCPPSTLIPKDLTAVKLDLCAVEIVGFCEREEKVSCGGWLRNRRETGDVRKSRCRNVNKANSASATRLCAALANTQPPRFLPRARSSPSTRRCTQ